MSDHQHSSVATTQTQPPQSPHTIQLQHDTTDAPPPPPPPIPSSDPRLAAVAADSHNAGPVADPSADEHDLFKLPPSEALRLLSASVELLVRITGDVPPTPPLRMPTNPQMTDMQAEKENIVRSHSEKSLNRLRQQAERDDAAKMRKSAGSNDNTGGGSGGGAGDGSQAGMSRLQSYNAAMSARARAQQQSTTSPSSQAIDGVHLRQDTAAQSPTSPPTNEPEPYVVIGADSQPLNLQHGAITRKFYSKNEPPISINQYLQRLHQFCPMSTAVYLATSLYIHRLAVEERAIPVTRRNAHRLVLAGLRVAMKALEDLSYPHGKIARVGGVSETELARLEISFCFLAGFELVVGEELLKRHWEELRGGRAQQALKGLEVPTLRLGRRPREVPAPGG